LKLVRDQSKDCGGKGETSNKNDDLTIRNEDDEGGCQ